MKLSQLYNAFIYTVKKAGGMILTEMLEDDSSKILPEASWQLT